ncbi:MAG: HAD-IA family hydrolase [Rhodospirillales bacterium]|nr:HAD-IA family hydrolase [Rhodospirillales bacterium]
MDRLKLVVLDCDGTLVDSGSAIVDTMHTAFAEHGLQRPSAEDVRRVVGLELLEAISKLAPGVASNKLDSVCASYREFSAAKRSDPDWSDPLYPGTIEAIEALSTAGILMGVATGKSRSGLDHVLGVYGLGEHFITLQTSDVAPGKPNPEMLYRAMRDAGAEVSATVMVGDTTFDMEMAANAKTHAIGVGWGYHGADELKAAGANIVIDRFQDLPQTVADLLR